MFIRPRICGFSYLLALLRLYSNYLLLFFHLADKPAGLTQLIIRRCEPGKRGLSGCHVTVSASSDGIRVIIGEGFVLLPGVETEYTLFVTRQGLISALYGHVGISVDIFPLAHLNGATAAVPAVRRVKLLPEQ